MFSKRWIEALDVRRWRLFVALFFLALAAPTAILIWQAYSQLKWESFHQYRTAADALSRRIDSELVDQIRTEDARSFADYSFVVVSGDPSANLVARSPLSQFPVETAVPGVIGYFQVDSAGKFTTPILPPAGTDATSLGISTENFRIRNERAQQIQTILADNRLVQTRPSFRENSDSATLPAAAIAQSEPTVVSENETALDSSPQAPPVSAPYRQEAFDDLNRRSVSKESTPAQVTNRDRGSVDEGRAQDDYAVGRVSELQLDDALEEKSQAAEEGAASATSSRLFGGGETRSKRVEQTVLPESIDATLAESNRTLNAIEALRVSTFESEIDPFEFGFLDSGHIVLFRKVWRDNERIIQGLLIDQNAFVNDVMGAPFAQTVLFDMSNLILADGDDVIRTITGQLDSSYTDITSALSGTLLHRERLSAPFSDLELIFSINRLPPGAGADVLSWITLILALVFTAGFVLMYRLGAAQIHLANQQRDFVSAVSHELKTPLTSIRMYGEMLKEGWADEAKRDDYYQFIHDESERLSKLIENVLQLSRISRNEPQFNARPTSIGSLMSLVESKISNQIDSAGFELKLVRELGADHVRVEMDEDCFVQIIINLVDNAIKFSKNADTKVIEIATSLVGEQRVKIAVRDHGPGVPKDQMKKIFERFYRSESELTRETVGTGIGLAIVHQLTLAMGGSVDLINTEPGAQFSILLPMKR